MPKYGENGEIIENDNIIENEEMNENIIENDIQENNVNEVDEENINQVVENEEQEDLFEYDEEGNVKQKYVVDSKGHVFELVNGKKVEIDYSDEKYSRENLGGLSVQDLAFNGTKKNSLRDVPFKSKEDLKDDYKDLIYITKENEQEYAVGTDDIIRLGAFTKGSGMNQNETQYDQEISPSDYINGVKQEFAEYLQSYCYKDLDPNKKDVYEVQLKNRYAENKVGDFSKHLSNFKAYQDLTLSYLLGDGDPTKANISVLDKNALKKGEYKYDYSKIDAFKKIKMNDSDIQSHISEVMPKSELLKEYDNLVEKANKAARTPEKFASFLLGVTNLNWYYKNRPFLDKLGHSFGNESSKLFQKIENDSFNILDGNIYASEHEKILQSDLKDEEITKAYINMICRDRYGNKSLKTIANKKYSNNLLTILDEKEKYHTKELKEAKGIKDLVSGSNKDLEEEIKFHQDALEKINVAKGSINDLSEELHDINQTRSVEMYAEDSKLLMDKYDELCAQNIGNKFENLSYTNFEEQLMEPFNEYIEKQYEEVKELINEYDSFVRQHDIKIYGEKSFGSSNEKENEKDPYELTPEQKTQMHQILKEEYPDDIKVESVEEALQIVGKALVEEVLVGDKKYDAKSVKELYENLGRGIQTELKQPEYKKFKLEGPIENCGFREGELLLIANENISERGLEKAHAHHRANLLNGIFGNNEEFVNIKSNIKMTEIGSLSYRLADSIIGRGLDISSDKDSIKCGLSSYAIVDAATKRASFFDKLFHPFKWAAAKRQLKGLESSLKSCGVTQKELEESLKMNQSQLTEFAGKKDYQNKAEIARKAMGKKIASVGGNFASAKDDVVKTIEKLEKSEYKNVKQNQSMEKIEKTAEKMVDTLISLSGKNEHQGYKKEDLKEIKEKFGRQKKFREIQKLKEKNNEILKALNSNKEKASQMKKEYTNNNELLKPLDVKFGNMSFNERADYANKKPENKAELEKYIKLQEDQQKIQGLLKKLDGENKQFKIKFEERKNQMKGIEESIVNDVKNSKIVKEEVTKEKDYFNQLIADIKNDEKKEYNENTKEELIGTFTKIKDSYEKNYTKQMINLEKPLDTIVEVEEPEEELNVELNQEDLTAKLALSTGDKIVEKSPQVEQSINQEKTLEKSQN